MSNTSRYVTLRRQSVFKKLNIIDNAFIDKHLCRKQVNNEFNRAHAIAKRYCSQSYAENNKAVTVTVKALLLNKNFGSHNYHNNFRTETSMRSHIQAYENSHIPSHLNFVLT